MKNRNEDYLSMLNLTEKVWVDKQSIFGNIIAVKDAFNEMIVLKLALIELSVKQSEAIGGKIINKKVLRKEMSELSAQMGQITAAYAYTIENEDLIKAVNFPISYYNQKRDEEVAELCKIVYEKVDANKLNLVNYGITQTMIDSLQGNISSYSGGTQSNKLDIKKRKVYTDDVSKFVGQLRQLVDNKLDKVMMIFQFTHPSDYKLYEEARNSMPKRHVKKSNGEITDEEAGILTGMVTDKADEIPIAGATVKLTGTGYQTETDSDGEYTFDSLPAGTYTIEVTLLDYQTATLTNQAVVAGDETVADFEMVKAI
jgi:hypothetical protein